MKKTIALSAMLFAAHVQATPLLAVNLIAEVDITGGGQGDWARLICVNGVEYIQVGLFNHTSLAPALNPNGAPVTCKIKQQGGAK